jgi:hypothetical protein
MATPAKTIEKKLTPQKKKLEITGTTDIKTETKTTKPKTPKKVVNSVSTLSAEQRLQMIADNAYFRALGRNFSAEGIESDWLKAECEINSWQL